MNSSHRSRRVGPAFVLLVSLIVTVAAGRQLWLAIEAEDARRFAGEAARVRELVVARVDAVTAVLDSVAGLVSASGRMNAGELHAFVAPLDLPRRHPEIRAIGLTRNDPERDAFQSVVAIEALGRGVPDQVGDELFGDPGRRADLERSRDSGAAALSAAMPPGFLAYVPVYRDGRVPPTVEERRAKHLGFVFAPVRVDDLLTGVFDRGRTVPLSFDLVDGPPAGPNALLYRRSRPADAPPPQFSSSSTIETGGRKWTIAFASLDEFDRPSPLPLVLAVLAAGTLGSLLLAAAVWTQTRDGVRAQTSADREADRRRQGQRELAEQRQAFRSAFAGIADAVIITGGDGRVRDLNAAAQALTGWTPEAAEGEPLQHVFPLVDEPKNRS